MISRTLKLLEIYDLDASEPSHFQKWPTLTIPRLHEVILFKSMAKSKLEPIDGSTEKLKIKLQRKKN
jgi:hypothetical protein